MRASPAPYYAALSARFRTQLQYRAAALAGVATQCFFGLIRVAVFEAFYRSNAAPQPMTAAQTVTYLWFGQAFLIIAMMGVDPEIAALIRSGNIAYELARPVDLFNFWLARSWAARAAPVVLRAPPILVLAAIFGQLLPPASWLHLLLSLISLLLALTLAATLFALVTLSLLWTVSGDGIARLVPPLVFFLSGMIVPLPLFPAWLQPVLRALPIRGLVDVPFRMYLGNLTPVEIAVGFVQQVVWIALFYVLGRWLLRRGLSRLIVQGG